MNRNTLWGTFAVILLLGLAGLVSQEEASSISSLNQLSTAPKLIASRPEPRISQLVDASNHFSFDLFNQLQLQEKSQSQNILISPQSMAIALAMTRNGTAGETQAEMTQVLKLGQLDPTTVDLSYDQLIKTLKNGNLDVELAIANSLWVNQNISLNQQFIQTTQDFYQGKVSNLNFADPTAKQIINQWVASNTAHKIPEIVEAIAPDDALYLLNAIYFKGSWTNKFDSNATTTKPFYLKPKTTKPVAMMSQTGDYRYYQNQDFQAIRLPYGKQGELGMYIFLPQENSNLEQFQQQLNFANWQEWLSQMRSQPGKVSLPKFKLGYETELKDVLASLGMGQVFDATQADFSAMTDSAVALNTVKHKAVIEVNEEGTEAAGVTSFGIQITAANPQNQAFEMNINRPFFFAIRDDITETVLFMGNVVEPQEN
ncbi:MAG: serpin family protein [Waterburya sp.]